MASERTRERILSLIRDMKERTVANGCTPGEAAKFSAKVAEWVERYQIEDAELQASGHGVGQDEEIEVCEHFFRTGKKAFNPGVSQVVTGLASGMCCKCILLHDAGEAVYGITGEVMDATIVCQLVASVVPALQVMARLDGIEHGYEKGGLIRWANQYLTGAGAEILFRLEADRRERSASKEVAHRTSGTDLVLVTGETVAVVKRKVAAEAFLQKYPNTRKIFSRTEYNATARDRGREAGKRVGLRVGIE